MSINNRNIILFSFVYVIILILLLFCLGSYEEQDLLMSGHCDNEVDLIYQLQNNGYLLDNGALKKSIYNDKYFKLYYKTISYLIQKNQYVNNKSSFSHCFKNYNHSVCKANYRKSRQLPGSYKSLIESFDKYGYDNKTPIIVDKDYNIIDGYHRMEFFIQRNVDKNKKILVLMIIGE